MFPNVKLVSVVYLFVVVFFKHFFLAYSRCQLFEDKDDLKKRDVAPICRILAEF